MKISIIIPVHNCAKYIAQTLDCIRLQTMALKEIEVLIYLDGCTDETSDIVNHYGRKWPELNMTVMCGEKPAGPGYARNLLARMAQGEYIHFMDADDLINTDFYRAMYDAAHGADADVAVCGFICERDAGHTLLYDWPLVVSVPQDKVDITRVDILGYSFRYMIRRKLWIGAKLGYPVDMKICEDMLPMNQMVFVANRLITVPGAIYEYKNRPGSLLNDRTSPNVNNENYKRATKMVSDFLDSHGIVKKHEPSTYTKFLLMDVIPVATIKKVHRRTWVRLFGAIPFVKLKNI